MLTFYYKAKNTQAQTVMGKLQALNREDAVEKITLSGLIPIAVQNHAFGTRDAGSLQIKKLRVRSKDLYFFSRQFASLLKSGVPILRALDVLAEQVHHRHFQRVIHQVREDIQGGQSFSESIANYPNIFPPIYIAMSIAGEEGGKLQEVIRKVSEHLKAQIEIQNKVRSALAYPLMMLIVGVGAVGFILTAVMPKVTQLFLDNQQDLPFPTVAVMALSNFLAGWWMAVLIALAVGIFILRSWLESKPGKIFKFNMALNFPVLAPIWLKEDLARFSRTMALLIESGVPIVRAMKLAIPTVSNIFIQQQLLKCQEELVAGRSFGKQIKQMSLIPDLMGDLIAVGEESGSLVPSLNDVADNYEQDVGDYVQIMTTLFEPLMIVVVGALIGFVVIAMLLPIFQMDVLAG